MRILLSIVLPALLAGCATVDYVGESYAPTTHVDVYYSESNVQRPYKTMGEVVATGDVFVSTNQLQEKMSERAREKGADAVVILGLEHVETGTSTNYQENTTESKDKKGRIKTTTTGSENTSVEEKKKIRAIFIKYTEPAAERSR
jgi:hypothetical protein